MYLNKLKKGITRKIHKPVKTIHFSQYRGDKPYVFIASSSLMQVLKVMKDLKANGFKVFGPEICDVSCEGEVFKQSLHIQDVIRCDAFIFFNAGEMTLWQGAMLGVALVGGKRILCVSAVGVEVEDILHLPQVEHFESWQQLMVAKFPMREKFLVKRMDALKKVINKLLAVPSKSIYRSKRVVRLSQRLKLMQREYDERFGQLSEEV